MEKRVNNVFNVNYLHTTTQTTFTDIIYECEGLTPRLNLDTVPLVDDETFTTTATTCRFLAEAHAYVYYHYPTIVCFRQSAK